MYDYVDFVDDDDGDADDDDGYVDDDVAMMILYIADDFSDFHVLFARCSHAFIFLSYGLLSYENACKP